MTIRKQDLIDIIHEIDKAVDLLINDSYRKHQAIKELQKRNAQLEAKNQDTLNQIKDYIKELEQIRSHHANSYNTVKK